MLKILAKTQSNIFLNKLFYKNKKIAKNFALWKPSLIQVWNCIFLIFPTSCAYFLYRFIHYYPQHGFAKEEEEIIDKNGCLCYDFVFFFPKIFSNGESKGKVKQKYGFFKKIFKKCTL